MAVNSDIVFQSLPQAGSPTNLVFGTDSGLIPVRTASVDFLIVSDVTLEAVSVPSVELSIDFLIESEVSLEATLYYDNRVIPYKDHRIASPMQKGVAAESTTEAEFQPAIRFDLNGELPWGPANLREASPVAIHNIAKSTSGESVTAWTPANGKQESRDSAFEKGDFHQDSRDSSWELGDQRRSEWDVGNQAGIFKLIYKTAIHETGVPSRLDIGSGVGASLHYDGISFFTAPWQMAGWPPPGTHEYPVTPEPPKFWWNANLLFEFPPLSAPNLLFGEVYFPPPPSAVVVPVQRIYMIANSSSLRRVDGNIQLPVLSMSISLDVSSWTWSFNATLPGAALPNLEPATLGDLVEVEATINGVNYRAYIEGLSRSRSFGKSSISIQGRGINSLLDAPYAPIQNFSNVGQLTANQIMESILTVNGQSMGWTVDFQLEDWSVPANVFNHQGTYITALQSIAQAAGGYIQPHASIKTIKVLPKYPSAPWIWNTVTPDYELPSDVTIQEGIQWVEKARYNRVFVSGVQSGVLGQVTRQGTAGDVLAPMVTDALITGVVPARTRGLSVLADTGRIANLNLSLPVLPATGIIPPGKFVRYVDGGVTRIGITRSVSVQVGTPTIRQTIGVQTHVY